MESESKGRNRDEVMLRVFEKQYTAGADTVPFSISDIRDAISAVAETRPGYRENNVPDVRYEYTSGRRPLPEAIDRLGPWLIQGRGKGKYAFVKLRTSSEIPVQEDLLTVLLPNATPEIVLEFAGKDEQGLLAKLQYNRLLDVFLPITCYHLQNHWRNYIKGKGQCEIDDLYVGLDADGKQLVIPIEAKCANQKLNKTQIVQIIDFAHTQVPEADHAAGWCAGIERRFVGVDGVHSGNSSRCNKGQGDAPIQTRSFCRGSTGTAKKPSLTAGSWK